MLCACHVQVEFLSAAFPGAKAHSGFLSQLAAITSADNTSEESLVNNIRVRGLIPGCRAYRSAVAAACAGVVGSCQRAHNNPQ